MMRLEFGAQAERLLVDSSRLKDRIMRLGVEAQVGWPMAAKCWMMRLEVEVRVGRLMAAKRRCMRLGIEASVG
jgi:hypothetical protein